MIAGAGTGGMSLRAVVAASIVVPALFVCSGAWIHYEAIMSATLDNAQREADVLSAQAAEVFETIDLVATQVGDRLRGMSWKDVADSAALRNDLHNIQNRHPQVAGIWLFDNDGVLRARGDASPPGSTMSQLARQPESESSIVTRHSDSGVEFGTAHYDDGAGGGSGGHIVVMISPRYFIDTWKDAVRNPDAVSLVQPDGLVLVRSPILAETHPSLDANSALAHAISRSERGVVETTSQAQRANYAFAFHKLPGRPVLIAYRADEQPALRRWRKDVAAYGALGALSAAALMAMGLIVRRRTSGQQLAWRRAITREAEQRAVIEAELQEAQKMEVVGQLAGGLAHDFGNVLAGVTMHLAALRKQQSSPWERERIIQETLVGITQGSKVVRSLLDLARRQPPKTETINVNDRLLGVESLLRQCLKPLSDLEMDLEPDIWSVRADAHSFELAILNLAINSRDAMPGGGTVRIRTRRAHLQDGPPGLIGDLVAIEVKDTGTGMDAQIVAHASEPFFTTKPVGEGTGLGLSQVCHFAEHSGGAATIVSKPGLGTTVTIYLPRSLQPKFAGSMAAHDDAPPAWRVQRDGAALPRREKGQETSAASDSRAAS